MRNPESAEQQDQNQDEQDLEADDPGFLTGEHDHEEADEKADEEEEEEDLHDGFGEWRNPRVVLLLSRRDVEIALQLAVHQITLICFLPLEIQRSVEMTQQ